uniref:Uncharacterized protein n=1 Tax=Arundo donax TaxID=35708 RepID=A0A0A9FG44_ARUDO
MQSTNLSQNLLAVIPILGRVSNSRAELRLY